MIFPKHSFEAVNKAEYSKLTQGLVDVEANSLTHSLSTA